MNGVFWLLTALVVTTLLVSYKEWPTPSVLSLVLIALGGFAAGVGSRAVRSRARDISVAVLRDNLEWADTGFSAILLAAVIMYFLVQAFKIPSGSMRNTLLEGDHLFVNKLVYGVRIPYTGKRVLRFRAVKHGDVVVFRFPTTDTASPHYGKDFIKRAIGLPGDTIEVRDKKVYVNGAPTDETYTHFEDEEVFPGPEPSRSGVDRQAVWERGDLAREEGENVRDNFGPVTVPAGHYFCMGDNRDRSYDSRFWGPMPDTHLKGRAWFVYWPLSRRKIIR
ncbi:MAG: signal peptidase I [Elusimicrobia bacterium]|nr:signal peptidase I [Elusimicrobiota bacterium]